MHPEIDTVVLILSKTEQQSANPGRLCLAGVSVRSVKQRERLRGFSRTPVTLDQAGWNSGIAAVIYVQSTRFQEIGPDELPVPSLPLFSSKNLAVIISRLL